MTETLLQQVELHHRSIILSLRSEHLNLCALAQEYNTLISVLAPSEPLIKLQKPSCFASFEDPSSSMCAGPKRSLSQDDNMKLPTSYSDNLLLLVIKSATMGPFPTGYGTVTEAERIALLPPPTPIPSTTHLISTVLSSYGPAYLANLQSAVPPITSDLPPLDIASSYSDPTVAAAALLMRLLSVEADSATALECLTAGSLHSLLPLLASWLGMTDVETNRSNPHVQRLLLSDPELAASEDSRTAFLQVVYISAAFIVLHEAISLLTTSSSTPDTDAPAPPVMGYTFLSDRAARREWRLVTAALLNLEENDEVMARFKWRDSVAHLRNFIHVGANL